MGAGATHDRVSACVRHPDRVGEIVAVESLRDVEQDRAIDLAHARGGIPDQRSRFLVGGVGCERRIRLDAATLVQATEAHVACEREQPGPKTIAVAQLRDALDRKHEHLTHRFGGLIAIAQDCNARAVDRTAELRVDRRELAATNTNTLRAHRPRHHQPDFSHPPRGLHPTGRPL